MSMENLGKFLVTAKRETYANKDAPKAPSSRPGSEDYHFEQGEWAYHDTYFGGRDFIGGEVVYHKKRPVWGMNYFGYVVDPDIKEKEVYEFLRKALMQPHEEMTPVRGPNEFKADDMVYRAEVEGDLRRFFGREWIRSRGLVLYQCLFHGGFFDTLEGNDQKVSGLPERQPGGVLV